MFSIKKISIICLFLIKYALISASIDIEMYENLNIQPTSAYAYSHGNSIFDFLPMNEDKMNDFNKFYYSSSIFVNQEGNKLGYSFETLQTVDFLKHFSFIYKFRKDFMPFISYYTPYKAYYKYNNDYELAKSQDCISLGIISKIENKTVVLSVDGNYSKRVQKDISSGVENDEETAIGFSNRILINLDMNRKSSMYIGVVTPVYGVSKKGDLDGVKSSFNEMIVSLGLKYKHKKWNFLYAPTYREFEELYDSEGKHLNYPWIIEHKFLAGYQIHKNVNLALDFKLQPSSYAHKPENIEEFRNSLGLYLGYEFNGFVLNFYYSDSRLFSDESMHSSNFLADVAFKF